MPVYPSKKDRPALRRAGRLAAIWGWCYTVMFLALFGWDSVPAGPLRVGVLYISLLFGLIGVSELFWRYRLLSTGEVRWLYVLIINEIAATLVLFWNLAWLASVSLADLRPLITPDVLKQMRQLYTALGQTLTQDVIDHSLLVAKSLTLHGCGGLLFLSQLWIIYRYCRLISPIKREASVPPILK